MSGDPATDDYLQNMENAPGIFEPEKFHLPAVEQFTADAKDVVRQLRDAYNSGDPDTQQAIRNYELQYFQRGHTDDDIGHAVSLQSMRDFGSGNTLSQERAWDLFYQAHQRYIGSALAREDPMTPETQAELERQQGFDMKGRPVFDFDPLIQKGIIRPRNVPDYVPRSQSQPPQQNVIDFDKLFKSGR